MGAPEREVVAVIGDGGIQMTLQELATLVQEKANVKILLLNNNFLGMVRQWQELFFDKRYSQTEMQNPDFQTLAKGFGITSRKVTERKELKEAMQEMMDSPSAFLLEVVVEKEENVFPMIPAGAAVDEVRLC
jgi:acetolactate synthase-1/2/3 large subunit